MNLEARTFAQDILEHAKLIQNILADKSFEDYTNDINTRLAVERLFSIIGEAMNGLARHDPSSAQKITAYPRIIAFRNILHPSILPSRQRNRLGHRTIIPPNPSFPRPHRHSHKTRNPSVDGVTRGGRPFRVAQRSEGGAHGAERNARGMPAEAGNPKHPTTQHENQNPRHSRESGNPEKSKPCHTPSFKNPPHPSSKSTSTLRK